MKILVTGATSFLGNYVVNDLLENGIDVIATSRSETKAKTFKWFDKIEYVPYNMNDSQKSDDNLLQYFRSPDKLIHLAWENLPNYTELFHIEKNLLPNYYFLKRMIDGGLKDITVTGTCLEYGMQNGCLSESDPTHPANSYAIAKDTLRRFINILNTKEQFLFKWIRLFYMYGKGQSEKSLFTQLEKAIENDDKEFRMSGGEQIRDFLPVEIVASHIRKITLVNSNLGIINCCSGKPLTVKSFVENYLSEKKKKIKLTLGYYPYPDYEPMEFWGDANKLNALVKQSEIRNLGMSEIGNQKILTISIPTFNRGILVKGLLDNITEQISKHKLENKVEVQITNNASSDKTKSIIQDYAFKHNYISCTNNETNIGLGPNVLKCMFLASGKYCLLLGDDDRLKPDSLPGLIRYLEENPETGLLLDTANNKKDKVPRPVYLTLVQMLERYYYFMGNAGVFVVLSSYVKENYEIRNFKGKSFSWPQTQFMIMSSHKHPEKKIYLDNFNLIGESEHVNITLYNSYYLWKVAYYELVEDIENIKQWVSTEVVRAARKYFSNHALQNFYNILQCGVFIDDAETKVKTRRHILSHLTHFSFKEKILLGVIVIVLWLPDSLSTRFSNLFIYLTRGKKGLEKKNNFVNHEKKKLEIIKSKKETIIRDFSFEGSAN